MQTELWWWKSPGKCVRNTDDEMRG
jgi:hypothetical protein